MAVDSKQVGWDESDRRKYLLGFSARKTERKEAAREKVKKMLAKVDVDVKKEQRKETKNYIEQLRQAKKQYTEATPVVVSSTPRRKKRKQVQINDGEFYGRKNGSIVRVEISELPTNK